MTQLVEHAALMPGACYFCGSSRGPFVDTNRDDDDPRFTGDAAVMVSVAITHIYICAQCTVAHAQLASEYAPQPCTVIASSVLAELRALLDSEMGQRKALEVENQRFRDALAVRDEIAAAVPEVEEAEMVPATPRRRR